MSLRSRSSLSSHGGDGGGSSGPVRLSQMIGSPTFRSSAINAVAMLPLLSSSRDGKDNPNTHSNQSYTEFLRSLHRYNVNENQQCFINWSTCSSIPNRQGRFPLHLAAEENVSWDDGLNEIVEYHPPAIESLDVSTGLELFMLFHACCYRIKK